MNRLVALFRQSTRRGAFAELMELDDHLLTDIGLTRGQVGLMAQGKRVADRRVVWAHG
jgi:uncharacterized protein YjiS (DUF1127 family)